MSLKISIIVITYNRLQELTETIENIRLEENEYEELILVDNCSTDGTREYGEHLQSESAKVKYYHLNENRGVAGGRNFAIKKASGDILVFLDDDAVWGQKDNLSVIRNKFEEETKLGVLAFKIVNYYSKEIRGEEFPFTDKKLSPEKERLTSTYIGAGHAIRRKAVERCGLYPEDFFYGGEELDLSFRIINEHYDICYFPTISVLHKQVQKARMKNDEKWIRVYRNRLIMGYKYLPLRYRMISSGIWYAKILLITKSIRIPTVAVKQYRKEKQNLKKIELNHEAMQYLRHHYGRLLY